jgi:hypothetical protein
MKRFSKLGLLLAVGLLAMAGVATGAQAVVISPNATNVNGTATNPTLTYQGVTVVCPNGTAAGTTGTNSDRFDVSLTFGPAGQCRVAGSPASVTCSGTASLIALDATNDTGTADLNPGFSCTITVPFTCSINVSGPQNPADNVSLLALNESTDVLSADVTINATRTGTSLCGPASGSARFVANYATTPSNLAINP